MPNIKSAKKRVKVTKVKDARNQAARSQLRTILKKFDTAVAGEDKAAAESAYKTAVKALDKAAAGHLIHKNKAANKKSALTLKLNASK
ncbi:30S ribosomal protein S20 [Butyricicoccus porcorum]|uniref:Small ribosomal subunit protein bS20 n=1 Tax=Butyricicoccus porcorum TaxID=1945634 RepID=A0A252F4B9_9FIRM|nr:30S ribosomal protein S20 [Butyricicoccus porcorum]MCI6926083.1 30S ribosomal protein S20 [Butyricicoccus porcorum]MDD6986035.1 30S ribosomal protein S20 [Butyricicoccus porcorum]MDY4483735.1 30S ribosomal protein S20 [Butyricicoccus porcorum]OUM20624.1 30S ribosomal protein S20 [Butyricicoccus porcorum]